MLKNCYFSISRTNNIIILHLKMYILMQQILLYSLNNDIYIQCKKYSIATKNDKFGHTNTEFEVQ